MTNYMDINEFREKGYLHELNRQFLHPLGLALEIKFDEDGNASIGGIWDYREDPEGIAFAAGTLSPEKAKQLQAIISTRMQSRIDSLGYWIQPVEESN